LFALVLTLPVVINPDLIRAPWHSNVQACLAVALGYYVVIRSYISWHVAMEDAPYWIRTGTHKTSELRRLYIDFFIVMSYVLLLLSTEDLAKHPGSDIGEYLALLAVVFVLYLGWGALRAFAYGPQHEFRWVTLVIALVGFAATWGAYRINRDDVRVVHSGATSNTVALAASLVTYATYRMRNWREMRPGRAQRTGEPTQPETPRA
jgi:hypothetical protein